MNEFICESARQPLSNLIMSRHAKEVTESGIDGLVEAAV